MLLNSSPNLRKVRERVEALLAPLKDELGVVIKTGKITYERDGASCSMKLECLAVDDKTGLTADPHEKAYLECCAAFGLPKDALHKEFVFQGHRYEVVGLKPRSTRFPVLGKRVDTNTVYKFGADAVLDGIKKAA